eukprot:SAG22_NODE_31_length_27697_cov_7.384376_24_plen_624_part_00
MVRRRDPVPRMLQAQDNNATGGPTPSSVTLSCAEVVSRGICGRMADLCAVECQADASAPVAGPALTCSAIASHGRCATMGDFCPAECQQMIPGAGDSGRQPDQICDAVATARLSRRQCAAMGDLCPAACSESGAGAARPTPPPPGQPVATSCATLIELGGGCAHDLSVTDPAATQGTRVSDVCPEECSGHGGCAPAAVDVSFLRVVRDGSGHVVEVELGGDACVDESGALFSGDGWAELAIGTDYVSDGACTVSFWLLKGAVNVWDVLSSAKPETIFSQPPAEGGGDFVNIYLARQASWYDHFSLIVQLGADGVATWSFAMDAHQDTIPRWTHISIVVRDDFVRLHHDGIEVNGEVTMASREMASGRPTTSSSSDWGGAPSRAVDGNVDGTWGSGSCTHTHPGDPAPWWQVDLGASSQIGKVQIHHRTDCCLDRMVGAEVVVSTTADFTATGHVCGTLDRVPVDFESVSCGDVAGQYITVSMASGYVSMCEVQVFTANTASDVDFRGVGLANTATVGNMVGSDKPQFYFPVRWRCSRSTRPPSTPTARDASTKEGGASCRAAAWSCRLTLPAGPRSPRAARTERPPTVPISRRAAQRLPPSTTDRVFISILRAVPLPSVGLSA